VYEKNGADKARGENMKKAHHPVDTTHLLEVVLGKIVKANLMVEVFLPTLDATIDTHWDEALLADNTAVATGLVASSQVGESISKIIELGTCEQLRRHVVLEPEHLWHLHLNAHFSTNIFEKLVLSVVDLLALFDRSVIEPQDDVAVIAIICEVWAGDGERLVGVVGEDGKRAGSIKANALDARGVDCGLADNAADTFADALPDICGGLFLDESDYDGYGVASAAYVVACLRLP